MKPFVIAMTTLRGVDGLKTLAEAKTQAAEERALNMLAAAAAEVSTPRKANPQDIKDKDKEMQAKPAAIAPPVPGPQSSIPKSPKDLLAQAEDLQNSFHRAGMAQHPAQPAAPGPQSFLRPTHRFDETSGNIVAIV